MRSISWKLAAAFLGISLFSIILVAVLARLTIGQEFDRYIYDQNIDNIVSALSEYYSLNGTWENLEQSQVFSMDEFRSVPGYLRPFSTGGSAAILDTANNVVMGSHQYTKGQKLSTRDLDGGIPITLEGETIGTLLVHRETFRGNPLALDFLRRMNELLIISVLGVVSVATVLGFLLSRNITRPIRELTHATQAVSGGEFGQQVAVHSRDELGDLAESFNKMSADLARSIHSRRQMTADIAHELRTPLSVILGHADGICEGVIPADIETVEIIRDEATRLEHLIDDLRVLSLADAGELSLNLEPVQPKKLLDDIHQNYIHQAKAQDIDLIVKTAENLPMAQIDPVRMTQVLVNIIENALRYTPERGKIILSVDRAENMVRFSIRDHGPGVPESEIDQIFNRFYRSDPSRHRAEGGSGLGLAIAKSIVERHGGRIHARQGEARGLNIIVEVPIVPI